jgi:hypothetical protein
VSALPAHRPPALQSLDGQAAAYPDSANLSAAGRDRASGRVRAAAPQTQALDARESDQMTDKLNGCPRCGGLPVAAPGGAVRCLACGRYWESTKSVSEKEQWIDRMVCNQLSHGGALYVPSGCRAPKRRGHHATGSPES